MANKNFDKEYEAAVKAARIASQTEPRAKSARYDKHSNRVVVELQNGASFLFPPELAQGLAGAAALDLANVRITPSGDGLRWPSLNADFSLSGLMMGVFGNQSWMAGLGRKDRSATSQEADAARANERRAGRPPKKKAGAASRQK